MRVYGPIRYPYTPPYKPPFAPRGFGALGATDYPHTFIWEAPAVIGLLGADWNTKAARLGNLLAGQGLQVSNVSWDWLAYIPPTYKLVVRGKAPDGVDGLEWIVARLAAEAGFSIDNNAISLRVDGKSSGSPGSGDDPDDPENKGMPDWVIPAALGAVVLMFFLRR